MPCARSATTKVAQISQGQAAGSCARGCAAMYPRRDASVTSLHSRLVVADCRRRSGVLCECSVADGADGWRLLPPVWRSAVNVVLVAVAVGPASVSS